MDLRTWKSKLRGPGWLALVWLVGGGAPARSAGPHPPTIFEPPADDIVLNPVDVHMVSGFSDPDSSDSHRASDYEIWDREANQRVWAALSITNFEKIHIHLDGGVFENRLQGKIQLEFERSYHLLVRHQDQSFQWGGYAERRFRTGSPSQIFPMVLNDAAASPPPVWLDDRGRPVSLPTGASLRLEDHHGDGVLFQLASQWSNPGPLAGDEAVRIVLSAGGSGGLALSETDLAFYDASGLPRTVYLPAVSLSAGEAKLFWVSINGSTYAGSPGQSEPSFSSLTRGSPVPWTVFDPNFRVEVVATGFQLPVHIEFVPDPGPNPGDPFYYVAELHHGVKVVTRDGTVLQYVDGLLNYEAEPEFSGQGETGITGIAVDPETGDLFVGIMYSPSGEPSGPWTARVVRLRSNDGGLTATGTPWTLIDDAPELYSWSHIVGDMSIGPDGKLYVPIGEGSDASQAQNLNNFKGKILRVNLDGTAPADNPFYDSSRPGAKRNFVWALGYRNPFGSAWRDEGEALYVVENGPSTDRFSKSGHGWNNGWGKSGDSDGQMFSNAINVWSPAHAPTSAAFIQESSFRGSGFPASKEDHVFVAESGPTAAVGPWAQGKRIVEMVLDPDPDAHFSRARLSGPETLVEYTGSGRATALGLAAGPDGLYFTDLYKDFGDLAAPGANVLRIRYRGTGSIVGSVRTSSGASIAGAMITVSPGRLSAVTDAGGSFAIASVPTGTFSVTASRNGFTVETRGSVRVVENDGALVDFTLHAGVTQGTISGTVTGASTGSPLAGARVATTTGGYQALTNAGGGYVLGDVAPGTYTLEASAAGFVTATRPNVVVVAGQDRLANAALDRVQPFAGIAHGGFEGGFFNDPNIDHLSGRSFQQFTLSGFSKSGGNASVRRSGSWSQSFWESRYVSGLYQAAPHARTGNRYRGSVYVRATDGSARFWVGIDPAGGTDAASSRVTWSQPVSPGASFQQVSVEATSMAATLTLFLKCENPQAFNVYTYFDDAVMEDLGPGGPPAQGTIAGTVRDTSGAGVAGATVAASPAGGTSTSTADGSYALSALAPGIYNVTASRNGFTAQTITGVAVVAGRTAQASFSLSPVVPTTGSVSGTVRSSAGQVLAGATVQASPGGRAVTTNADGAYSIADLTPGSYQLTASAPGFGPQTRSIPIIAGGSAGADFSLSPAPALFQGLQNGSFEGGFFTDPDGDHKTPSAWKSFVLQGKPKYAGYWHASNHSPDWSHMIYEGGYVAGIHQRVEGARPANLYTASVWVKAFNSDVDFWIGIDPRGGTDPNHADFTPAPRVPGSTWSLMSRQVLAQSSAITVFIKSRNRSSGNRNAWIDDAVLVDDGPAAPSPKGSIGGIVSATNGAAIGGATVQIGTASALTAPDGSYRIEADPGTYTVNVSKSGFQLKSVSSVSVSAGQSATVNVTLVEIPPPPANRPPAAVARAVPTSGNAPLLVQLNGSASSDPDGDRLSFLWSFGDGSPPSSEADPSHAFTSPGTFPVTLTVNDGRGGTHGAGVTIEVAGALNRLANGGFAQGLQGWKLWKERGTPNAQVTALGQMQLSGTSHNGGLYQQFSTGGAGTRLSIGGFWASDPTVANAQWAELLVVNGTRLPSDGTDIHAGQSDVVTIYKNDTWASPGGWSGAMSQTAPVVNAGSFVAAGATATLVLKSGSLSGVLSGARFDNLVVSGGSSLNQPPAALASATPLTGTAPLAVSFDGHGSSDPDGDPLSYAWDFGNGAQGVGARTAHTYDRAGSFAVRLTVSDGRGGSGEATLSIQVQGGGPQPSPIDWDPRLSQLGLFVTEATVTPGTGYWKLVKARFESDGEILPPPGGGSESNGTHNIFYRALDVHGNPIQGQKLVASWPAGNPANVVQHATKGPGIDDFWGNFPLPGGWCPYYPVGPRGPFGAYVSDAPSDQVWGMGLPCNRHVSYRLTWRFTIKQ